MSNRTIVFIILIIVALVVAGVFFLRPDVEKIDINRGEPSGRVDQVPQVITKVFSEDNGRYSVTVEYPELQGISTPGVRDKINGAIKTAVYNQIAGFQAGNGANLQFGEQEFKSSFDGNFDVSLLTGSFFSGVMSYSEYSAGAAHPNSYNVALNYDLKTGTAVTLNEFLAKLNPSEGYMGRLGGYVRTELIRQFGDSEGSIGAINLGAAPTTENYSNFVLDAQGLSIIFDPYQVAPYAAGSPQVSISYDKLAADVIKSADRQSSATSSVEWWLQ